MALYRIFGVDAIFAVQRIPRDGLVCDSRPGVLPSGSRVTEDCARRSAHNGQGPWWNAGASHMNAAFPKRWFDALGLVSLLDTRQRLQRYS